MFISETSDSARALLVIETLSVWKLMKARNGLKQSPKPWFSRFNQAIKVLGYHKPIDDHILFFKQTTSREMVLLLVYVDDIINN